MMNGKFSTNTVYSKDKSLSGHIGSQIYSHKNGFVVAYHLHKATGDTLGYSLSSLIHEYGMPGHLTFDGIPTQTGSNTLFMKTIRRAQILFHVSQLYRPNENPAEGCIREIKQCTYRIMYKKKIPKRLWDFVVSWVCETGNVISSSSRYAHARTSLEILTGETPNITEYLDFGLYNWVTFKKNAGFSEPQLGRRLGVSHRVGPLMSYWILP